MNLPDSCQSGIIGDSCSLFVFRADFQFSRALAKSDRWFGHGEAVPRRLVLPDQHVGIPKHHFRWPF